MPHQLGQPVEQQQCCSVLHSVALVLKEIYPFFRIKRFGRGVLDSHAAILFRVLIFVKDNLVVVLLTPRDDLESQNNQKEGIVVGKALLDRGNDAIVAEVNWRDTLVDRGGSVLLAVSVDDDADDDADDDVMPSMRFIYRNRRVWYRSTWA